MYNTSHNTSHSIDQMTFYTTNFIHYHDIASYDLGDYQIQNYFKEC